MPCKDDILVELKFKTIDKCCDEDTEKSECQPFCKCDCCNNVIGFPITEFDMNLPAKFRVVNFSDPIYVYSEFLARIWLPPKLS